MVICLQNYKRSNKFYKNLSKTAVSKFDFFVPAQQLLNKKNQVFGLECSLNKRAFFPVKQTHICFTKRLIEKISLPLEHPIKNEANLRI